MAADEKETTAATDSEIDALFKKAMKKISTGRAMLDEAAAILEAVYEPAQRTRSALDANGEPTWDYLVKMPIPKDIHVTKAFAEYAARFEMSLESAQILMNGKGTYEGFRAYYQRVGTKWQSWTMVWQKWVRSEHERKQKAKDGKNSGRATRFDQQRTRG